MKKFLKNKNVRFILWLVIYSLFVIWLRNFFLLIGLAIIVDHFKFRKVRWLFWKKWDENKQYIKPKRNSARDWADALIFAITAAYIIRLFFIEAYKIPTSSMEETLLRGDFLFVSKYHYGPRTPITPLAIPFTHHTLFGKTKAYLDWIEWDYKRLGGITEVKRYDKVVFNFPVGDTVVWEHQAQSYYSLVRQQEYEQKMRYGKDYYSGTGRKIINDRFTIIKRPLDKKENYIKRCTAIPGDTLQIKDGKLYINNQPSPDFEGLQYRYILKTKSSQPINKKIMEKFNITEEDYMRSSTPGMFIYVLNNKAYNFLKNDNQIVFIEPMDNNNPATNYIEYFPHDSTYYSSWTQHNYGPIVIPKKGNTIDIDISNISLYKRIIDVYENHDLKIAGKDIYIDGKIATNYTFEMDYYWMMGDNRNNSQDSRFWGFVPETHIVGKALFIWWSLDPEKSWFDGKIRFKRIFKFIH